MSPEQRLEEICLEAIKELVDSGVVDRQEDELSATRAFRFSLALPRLSIDSSCVSRVWRRASQRTLVGAGLG